MNALVTGAYGQDGSFVSELLYREGYSVFGIVGKELSSNSLRIKKELEKENVNLSISNVNILDYNELKEYILSVQPNEIYHLAALHVSAEEATLRIEKEAFERNVLATSNILDICYNFLPNTKILTAGSCLMYDGTKTLFQNDDTEYKSFSYYGIGKIAENNLVSMYREKGLYACTAVLYNHESHRRSSKFITQKIVENMVRIKKGLQKSFVLGNVTAEKDWGFAGEYASAMHLMLLQEKPRDYILSSGNLYKISDFLDECSKQLGLSEWRQFVDIDSELIKREATTVFFGKSDSAKELLGWNPRFLLSDIVKEMVDDALERIRE